MDKEFLNQICQRGKNSRGGKGAWQRNHPGEIQTRRQTTEETAREASKIRSIGQIVVRQFTVEDRASAKELLTDRFNFDAILKRNVYAIWSGIKEQQPRKYIMVGDAQYREAAAFIYSLYVWMASPEDFEAHARELMQQLQANYQLSSRKRQLRKIASPDDILRALIRTNIEFGPIDEDDRHQVWRLSAAIRYLISQNVKPGEIEQYWKDHGGGVDTWSRAAPRDLTAAEAEIADEVGHNRERTVMQDMEDGETLYYHGDDVMSAVKSPEDRIWEADLIKKYVENRKLVPMEVRTVYFVADARGKLEIFADCSLGLRSRGKLLKSDIIQLINIGRHLFHDAHFKPVRGSVLAFDETGEEIHLPE